ncbi:MAG: twin-arginine translocation signal domain-containing protein [Thermoguttaceae bacterium]|nr:twin-arginine translocation signal domain-containing protein [Thermoguttaceae bacterium]
MCNQHHATSCSGCGHALNRRGFLRGCGAAVVSVGVLDTYRTRRSTRRNQAKAVRNLDADRGCRTQLLGEVRGDIGKLFNEWDRFGWHRVTLYGDVQEPLAEFGKALGLEIIYEA